VNSIMSFQQILYIWVVLTIGAAVFGPLSNLIGGRTRKLSSAFSPGRCAY
jgi:hypothetical protein